VKTDVLRRIGKQTGIRGFSPEEETEGYDGKDLQERKVLSLEWDENVMRVVDGTDGRSLIGLGH